MNPIIRQLQQDHSHFQALIACLKEHLTSDSSPIKNNYLILDIIDYLQVYPKTWHHPVEMQLYTKLLERADSSLVDLIEELYRQHSDQENKAKSLRVKIIEQLKKDSQIKQPTLLLILQYLEVQALHIRTEERKVFPLAKIILNEDDWQQITENCLALNSNSSSKIIKKEYDNLYYNILDFQPIQHSHCNP